jgi:hypothetical protein
LSPDFAFGLYELDYDIFGVHIAGAVNRVPCLEQVHRQIKKKCILGLGRNTPLPPPPAGERVRRFDANKLYIWKALLTVKVKVEMKN